MSATSATLIFPHQLFRDHPALEKGRPVWLVEETLFFRQLPFHKKKMALHRASMKAYEVFLESYRVHYIESHSKESDVRVLLEQLGSEGVKEVHFADPVDDWLERRMNQAASDAGITLLSYDSPNFLNSPSDVASLKPEKRAARQGSTNPWLMAGFYSGQRKKRKILVDAAGKPEGGKWSFDTENRKRLPAAQKIPSPGFPVGNPFVAEALTYVAKHFNDHFGDLSLFPGGGFYPVDFAEADAWLDRFLQERFASFGPYEDAMVAKEHFLFHSVLTPMLNIGLLDPATIISRAQAVAAQKKIPLASLEGFLRQIMGWREFVRILYVHEGRRQRTSHFWGFYRKIPMAFWEGNTGIPPVDGVIKKVKATGYAHHIERLMVMGNFMLLCEFDPDEVYRWFMECFIDAYDWVMVPNVYGMSQFADGGLMTTKPYLSGANYLLKMGNWEKGAWEKIWNSLFWRFLHTHEDQFAKNPRWKMLLVTWKGMDSGKQKELLQTANDYLQALDDGRRPVHTVAPASQQELF